jgi:glycosyltransferase involved in cell wall biosynthesis
MSKRKIIVIVPCYNEEDSLPALLKALEPVRQKVRDAYLIDILLINDGSSDQTQAIIKRLSVQYPRVFYRQFAQNAGHQSALRAGLAVAVGYDAAVMMDGDLQHPPECIPEMLKTWESTGSNIVQMLRKDNRHDVGLFKNFTSHAYYKLLNYLSGLKMEYGSSDFRLIDNLVIRAVEASPERDLFLRGYFSWLKAKRTNIEYVPNKRFAGSSKYTFKKMMTLARQGVLQFSEKPLQLATNIGLLVAALSFVYGIFLILSYGFGGKVVSGWTSLMVAMLFCFGINFILIGVTGRYLAHAMSLQKQRPEYIVVDENVPAVS